MGFGDIGGNVPLLVVISVIILLQFFLRRGRKAKTTNREITQNLLSEVRLDLAITEVFNFHWRTKTFMTTSWQMNKTKLDFLDQSLQVALSEAFIMAEDFNRQIKAAKKYRSTSYMTNIDVDKLKEPLTKSKQGLEQWLQSATGIKESRPKYPGVLDDWLGRR